MWQPDLLVVALYIPLLRIEKGRAETIRPLTGERFEWPALRRDQMGTGELFVEFDDHTIKNNQPGLGVRIEPCTIDFDGQGKIERRMLPLILSWAVTVHKLQGSSTLFHSKMSGRSLDGV